MAERAKILVVDDNESVRKVLATTLAEEYVVDTAENGKEAIKKSTAKVYNLALIDIRLPDMEGIELLTKMRNTTPKMRKIIITGYPKLQNAIEALNRGADVYILKPFNMEEVMRTVEEQLKRQRKEKKYCQEQVAEFIETRARELEKEEL